MSATLNQMSGAKQTSRCQNRFHELIDGQRLYNVIDNLDLVIPKERVVYSINGEVPIDQKAVLRKMSSMLHNGELGVNYLYSRSMKTHGRQYAQLGLSVQSISREIRHTLCADTYRDFDVQNCHPSIALQYCQKHGWDTPYLKEYVENRDEHRDKLIKLNKAHGATKDSIKTMILSVLNGGVKEYKETTFKTEWLNGLYIEINEVFNRIMSDPENEGLIQEAIKCKYPRKKDIPSNPRSESIIKRSVCNRVWVDIENDILNSCIKWCEHNCLETKNMVLMFDGFMLPKHVNMPEDWAQSLSDWVFDNGEAKAYGYRMTFTEKIMDEGTDPATLPTVRTYKEPPRTVDESLLRFYIYNRTDKALATLCYQAFGHNYCYDGSTIYHFRDHKWSPSGLIYIYEDAPIIGTLMHPFYSEDEYGPDNKESLQMLNSAVNGTGVTKNVKNMLEMFKPLIYDKDFHSKLDAQKHLIGFKNGVLDTNTKVFRKGLPTDYITLCTRYNYNPVIDWSAAKKFIEDILDAESAESMKSLLAGILRGGNPEQKFNFWIGGGSNGKSLLSNALEIVLGGYYCTVPKETYTKEVKHANAPDPGLCDSNGTHMAMIAETDQDDKFQASVFKGRTGNDTLTGRRLNSNVMISFKPMYKPIVMSQYPPKFSCVVDEAIIRRLRVYPFPYHFVYDPKGPKEKLRIDNFHNYVRSDEFRDQLLALMLHSNPECEDSPAMKEELANILDELNPLIEWFRDNYEPDRDSILTVSDVRDEYLNTENSTDISKPNFTKLLSQITPVKKIQNNNIRAPSICGYKLKPKPVKTKPEGVVSFIKDED